MNHRQRESILCRVKFDICAALPLPLPLCVSVSLQNHTGIFKTHMLLFPLRAENIQPAKQKHVPKYLNYVTFMQNVFNDPNYRCRVTVNVKTFI